jgi:DNA mismatch repair protein MutL
MLMTGRFPIAFLFLKMPPEEVDINVHPTKAEVRFKDRDLIFRGIGRAVRRALLAHAPVPGLHQDLRWSFKGEPTSNKWDPAWELARDDARTEMDPGEQDKLEQPSFISREHSPILRLVGQVASSYLVAEGPDGLYLIDQHAAHERVLFERYMSQKDGTLHAQTLLEAVTMELTPASSRVLNEQLPILRNLGFEVEQFGKGTFLVRAIPELLSGMDPEMALSVLVDDFEEDESPLEEQIEAKIIARICKRAAVKAGQVLNHQEQLALLKDLESCQAPRTCPHGRPTMIHLSVDLLERQFGRRGAR